MDGDHSYDAFLSYSSADKAVVEELARSLESDGLRVWIDTKALQGGDVIGAKIEEGLAQSRRLVFFMSAHALESDWAKFEQFTARFADPLNRNRRFIPVRLDDAPIPGVMQQFHYIDWRGKAANEYRELVELLRSPLAPAPSERPRTTPPPVHRLAASSCCAPPSLPCPHWVDW